MPVYRNYGNKWNDGLDDYRDNKREGVRRRGRNTPMHQENWNEGEGSHGENFGLGDTSQGSANYGHVDDGHGSRYYGTGNYGGYFGSGSDEDDNRSRHQQEHRGNERRNEYFDDKNLLMRSPPGLVMRKLTGAAKWIKEMDRIMEKGRKDIHIQMRK